MPPQTQTAPDESRLKLLLAQGESFIPVVQQLVDQFKLQYTIELVDGKPELKDALKGSELHLKRFITVDPETIRIKDDCHKLAKCEYPVLIHGETGTGKEIIAKAMIGDRKGYIKFVNCAGLPETLMESELFGYERGSFTGAIGTKQGLMADAENGVIFFDEIGELPLTVQAKLLRAIQEKKVRKVGGSDEKEINCKVVCATNKNLNQLVVDGLFRQDLYARISTFEVYLKPLRERQCDIIPIIKSMKMGEQFLDALHKAGYNSKNLDTKHNVRSLEQYVRRFEVLGRVAL